MYALYIDITVEVQQLINRFDRNSRRKEFILCLIHIFCYTQSRAAQSKVKEKKQTITQLNDTIKAYRLRKLIKSVLHTGYQQHLIR